jgi:hypothetical protein
MKNWKILVCLAMVVFFVVAATACSQSGASNSATNLRGSIQKDDAGGYLYITSGGKHYRIDSQKDLTPDIGKMVTLKGAVTEKDGHATIVVSSVEE